MAIARDTASLEKNFGHKFKDKNLLKEALTHRSYLNENPAWGLPNNERLEFLGDAVLELAVTEELFNRYPDYNEGQLTALRAALVNYQILAAIGHFLVLENFVLLSRGEAKDTGRGREVILANTLEAMVGAAYLDSNYGAVKKIINNLVMIHLEEVVKKGLYKDAKSLLQEKIQAVSKVTPVYRLLSESGPDHAKSFTVGVYAGEKLLAQGSGASKQDAEIEAAQKALETL